MSPDAHPAAVSLRGILYYTRLDEPAAHEALESLAARLPYARLQSLDAAPHARVASLTGIALAMQALRDLLEREVSPSALRFPAGGKPYMPGAPDFSVSHSGALVACAAAWHGVVGLDIESDPRDEEISLRAVCSDTEMTWAREAGTRSVWVRKEAALKALGGTLTEIATVRLNAAGARFRRRQFFCHDIAIEPACVGCIMASDPAASFAPQARSAARVIFGYDRRGDRRA